MREIPEGFAAAELGGGFVARIGPVYELILPDGGGVRLGVLVDRHHLNPAGMSHGGLLATLMDVGIAYNAAQVAGDGAFFMTMGLNLSFLSGARPGDWIETRSRVSRRGRSTLFGTGEIWSGERLLMTGSGIYAPWQGKGKPTRGYADFQAPE
jgi:uncharacterized protein (TIGR00369 family)